MHTAPTNNHKDKHCEPEPSVDCQTVLANSIKVDSIWCLLGPWASTLKVIKNVGIKSSEGLDHEVIDDEGIDDEVIDDEVKGQIQRCDIAMKVNSVTDMEFQDKEVPDSEGQAQ